MPASDRIVRRKLPSEPSSRPRANMALRIPTIMAWISRPGDTLERTCQAFSEIKGQGSGHVVCRIASMLD